MTSAMSMDLSAREHLRRDTRETHDALERHPVMALLMSPRVTLAAYTELLRTLHGAYARYCPHIEASLGVCRHGTLAPTDLVGFLERDLRALGQWPVEPDQGIALPLLDTELKALGAWYVLEGSAQGGSIIGRRLRKLLGNDLPVCYMAERDDGQRWKSFDGMLTEKLAEPAALEPITDGANTSYRFTVNALDRVAGA